MSRDLDGQQVTVMGLGRFGGGAGVTRWLAEQGAQVLVTDKDPPDALADSVASLDDLIAKGRVKLRLGEHNVSDFTTADLVIANPAVPLPWDNRFLRSACAAGVRVTTEIRLLVERLAAKACTRIIGVTGSAGKSTTTTMIHHVLQRSGARAHLGGNIGGSLLATLGDIRPDDWIVLELSSAMLYWLGAGAGFPEAAGWSPHVAVLTNINPNHIDWHGSFEHYRTCKLNIFRWQRAGDHQVRGEDVRLDDLRVPLRIPGSHNQWNGRLALTAAHAAVGINPEDAAPLLQDFAGLPHRLQLIAERDGLRFYNDSKSTTPEATVLAVRSFDDTRCVHLIAGGYDKKIDLSAIAALARETAGLYAIGETGAALAAAASRPDAHVIYCATLDRAVAAATARMQPGHILLLSPGCASWDQFTNFEQRGEDFARLVQNRARTSGRATPQENA